MAQYHQRPRLEGVRRSTVRVSLSPGPLGRGSLLEPYASKAGGPAEPRSCGLFRCAAWPPRLMQVPPPTARAAQRRRKTRRGQHFQQGPALFRLVPLRHPTPYHPTISQRVPGDMLILLSSSIFSGKYDARVIDAPCLFGSVLSCTPQGSQ